MAQEDLTFCSTESKHRSYCWTFDVFYTQFAFVYSSCMILECMKCFLKALLLSEKVHRYCELQEFGEVTKNMTGCQASLGNSVFIITMVRM